MLEGKRIRLDGLLMESVRLKKQITSLEGRISDIDDAPKKGVPVNGVFDQRSRRNLPRNNKPLKAVVIEVLTKHKPGLTLRELAAAVQETGHNSSSVAFEKVVYKCLYNHSTNFHYDAETRIYSLLPKRKRTSGKKTTADSKPKQAG